MTKPYRYLDQTSDLGLEVYGDSLRELFENGCFALFDNMVELEGIEEAKSIRLRMGPSASKEELFLDWLRELIYRFNTDYFVPKRVKILKLDESTVEAQLWGERFDPNRHKIRLEIKSPTYHLFSLEKLDNRYRARILFDV